jgi:hypothetical protein
MGGSVKTSSPARWKSSFLTLPDAAFFDILRNYLGDFKTPYNKHSLLESLEQFLRKPETRERIISLIDREDAKILTALEVLNAPGPDDLYHLFEGDLSYLDLHHRLINFQDRLLIYTDRSSGRDEIFLNPFLADDLRARIIDPGLLVSSESVSPVEEGRAPWLRDSLLMAFLSGLLEESDIFKTDGSLKKKAEAALREKFSVLFGGSIARRSLSGEDHSRITLLIRALKTLKLVRLRETALEADLDAWKEFAAFPELARLCMIARGAVTLDFFSAWREAEWLASFLTYLSAGRAYSSKSLIRLGRLISGAEKEFLIREEWIDNLRDFEILLPWGEDSLILNPRLPGGPSKVEETAVLVQPNFDISVKPSLSLREGFCIAAAAAITKYDVYPQYELSKESFSRALALGFEGARILENLKNLSGGRLPQNVAFSLEVWEREYESLSFFEGIVVMAGEERRHLLDHHRDFQKLVKLNPAPGVYVLGRSGLAACAVILREAGIEILPRLRKAEDLPPPLQAASGSLSAVPPAPPFTSAGIIFPRMFSPPVLRLPRFDEAGGKEKCLSQKQDENAAPGAGERKRAAASGRRGDIRQELLNRLGEAKLPEDLSGEIRERIKQKLIIFPEQIRPELARRERTEAKGLNYVGKTLVIEQALKNASDYLETVVRSPDGSPSRLLIRPKTLRRSGADLVLEGHSIPDGAAVEIHVKKISLVRRLRASLSG